VRLVVSDAHVGLTKAVGRMFQGCSWQRCRVHFARNLLQTVPKAQQEMVAAALRSVFTQRRLSGKKSARGADLSTSESILRVEHHGPRDRQMAVIESWSEAKD
jgi:transposase-like protein